MGGVIKAVLFLSGAGVCFVKGDVCQEDHTDIHGFKKQRLPEVFFQVPWVFPFCYHSGPHFQ